MTTPPAVLVLNPASGDHDADETEAAVVGALEDGGYEVEVRRTEGEGDATRWATEVAEAGDAELLLAAGGDGHVREVVSGVVRADGDVTVGVVPMGTANLLARALAIPVGDPAAAAAVATAGDRRRIDVLHLVDRDEHALLMVDAGFDAKLVRSASRRFKDLFGAFAYVGAGFRHTIGLDDAALALEVDGEDVVARGHSVLCLNIGRIGRTVVVDEEIQPDDGLIHVGIVERSRPWSVLWTAAGMVVGGRSAHPNTRWLTCERLVLRTDPPLELQLDGDPIGETPVELELLQQAVELCVPG